MIELQVTELGLERRCQRCGEFWPLDGEFWHRHPKGIGGFNNICRACRGRGLRRQAAIDDAQVYAMFRNGRTVQDIAVTLGVSEGAIYKRQKAYRERRAA